MSAIEQYAIFLLQVITVVVALLVILAFIINKAQSAKQKIERGSLQIRKVNEELDELKDTVTEAMLDDKGLKQKNKADKAAKKAEKKSAKKIDPANEPKRKRLFVIDFHGDMRASAVDSLQEEINAILLTATVDDEVLVRLESGGGLVNAYGLAASQLHRLRTAKIPLTIAIDKVAASGGYMMACVGNHIIAAPFAIIGSIGVVAQLPNLHRLLKHNYIDFEQITAGEYKRTMTLLGENDNKGRQKMQADINETHELFKNFIRDNREMVDLDQVANGDYWYGSQAINLKLVDVLQTSDDYLLKASENCDIYHLAFKHKLPPMQRFLHKAEAAWLKWRSPTQQVDEERLLG